jgi:class 3 adenylate cyclase
MTWEISVATLVVCLVHWLKPKIGLTGLFVVVGLFVAYLFVAGYPIGDQPPAMGVLWPFAMKQAISTTYLPTILVSFVLVYVLESVHAARQLIYAVILVFVVSTFMELQVDFHAFHPPDGIPVRDPLYKPWLNLELRVAGLVAFCADFVVIIASYQWLVGLIGKLRLRIPLALPLFFALVLAMVVDAITFGSIYFGTFTFEGLQLGEKLVTGVAAGLPASIYFQWQIRKLPQSERRGLFERSPLEIVTLKKEIEQQRLQYAEVKKTFGRYVSPEVVELLMADPTKLALGGEERDVAILFADLRGYSTLSEHLSPGATLDLLNRFFDRVNRVVQRHRGMVNNYLGDGVLAVFGAPLPVGNHAEHATLAALDLLVELDALNAELTREGLFTRWKDKGIDALGVRVGLHCGKVVVGNLGNEQRTDYAVIGDVVNTAARLEALNKTLGTTILLTDAIRDALSPALRARLSPHGSHQVKGREQGVAVFSIT